MKASLSASDYASYLVSSDLRSLVPIIEFAMKPVRRDEVARPYGVSGQNKGWEYKAFEWKPKKNAFSFFKGKAQNKF